jgi:hypothetical protein
VAGSGPAAIGRTQAKNELCGCSPKFRLSAHCRRSEECLLSTRCGHSARPLALLHGPEQQRLRKSEIRLNLVVILRWAAPCVLILCLVASDRKDFYTTHVRFDLDPQAIAAQEYRLPPDYACGHDQQGKFQTGGNRWQRFARLCIDQVILRFDAFPDPSLDYSIESDRCPNAPQFGRFIRPKNFFHRPVPKQISLLRRAIREDLREFARQCGLHSNLASFVDDRLDRFYLDFGDGWWFDRIKGDIRLTPHM